MTDYAKPLPAINDLNRPFWEGAKQHKLLIQKCRDCGHLMLPPLPNCPDCLSTELEWVKSAGRGQVFSFITYHQAWLAGFREDLPYNVAIIELNEGVRFISNVTGPPESLSVGMPVSVTFDDVTNEVSIPKFAP